MSCVYERIRYYSDKIIKLSLHTRLKDEKKKKDGIFGW